MRLIDTTTGRLAEFNDSSTAPWYAILSHTWARKPYREQTYQDMVKIQEKFGLTSPLDPLEGEILPNPPPGASPPTPTKPAVLIASEPPAPAESALSATQLSQLSPSISALLRYLLISILARAALYILLGSSEPPQPEEHHLEAQTPPPPPHRSIWDEGSGLSEKVRKACEIARRDGYRYIWVDSSCIDKTSSSELSEAINSMFKWYRDAQICYAFLADVPSNDVVRYELWFRKSQWFKRVWTLQELIAPRVVRFLSKDWKALGTKDGLADLIQKITHIDPAILTHERKPAEESVAEGMRWASDRKATRVEDEAYSLLGIFGITMTTLYGEGRRAFQRLQEEILQRIPDRSLFAWGECLAIPPGSNLNDVEFSELCTPFALSPWFFHDPGCKIHCLSQEDFKVLGLQPEEYTFTPPWYPCETIHNPPKRLIYRLQ